MGIRNFYDFIKRRAPEQIVECMLKDFDGYRVAIDTSVYLYTYIRSAGPINWVGMFLNLILTLKRAGLRLIFVFDGKAPPEKDNERKQRRLTLQKSVERLNEIKSMHLSILNNGPINIEQIRAILRVKIESDGINWTDRDTTLYYLNETVEKLERQTLPITPEYAKIAQRFLDALGMPWFQAKGEAETTCALMACRGCVDCVLTEDTDVMVYGTTMMLSKLRLREEKVACLQIIPLLESVGMTLEQFRDLCIMLGCDYNHRVKMWNKTKKVSIGVVRAIDLIEEYKSLDKIEPLLVDATPLNIKRCRSLFTLPNIDIKVPPLRKPIWSDVKNILSEYNVPFDIETVQEVWKVRALIIRSI